MTGTSLTVPRFGGALALLSTGVPLNTARRTLPCFDCLAILSGALAPPSEATEPLSLVGRSDRSKHFPRQFSGGAARLPVTAALREA